MLGKIIILSCTIVLLACAKPRYENININNNETSLPAQKLSDCPLRLKNSGYCVTWAWEQKPMGSQAGSITFKILRANLLDQSIMPADITQDVTVLLWMPSMDHGSTPVKVSKVDTGSYRATNVRFVMPGDWEIRFQIKDGNNIQDEAIATILF